MSSFCSGLKISPNLLLLRPFRSQNNSFLTPKQANRKSHVLFRRLKTTLDHCNRQGSYSRRRVFDHAPGVVSYPGIIRSCISSMETQLMGGRAHSCLRLKESLAITPVCRPFRPGRGYVTLSSRLSADAGQRLITAPAKAIAAAVRYA
jgi:hypothetical protein